ncbi:B12-binding domain-containing radical SAM protein, partial [candidate division KSB3 bacterium]
MSLFDKILTVLPHVSHPIQYVGQEWNAVQKPWEEIAVKVALCFPDTYEVGMPHLGLHLLYDVLNRRSDVLAERIFAPTPDMEQAMRSRQIPLFSLESHRDASTFDLLGFTLQYELSYSNILSMLSLANVPFLSKDRTKTDPFVIAGGPCSYNPEPVADFFDLIVLGDAETVFPGLVSVYNDWKAQGRPRIEFLQAACRMPGVYVPSFYAVRYHKTGEVAEIVPTVSEAPELVRKVTEPDLDAVPYLSRPIIPYLKPVHDRLTLEIMRGCPRGCRFCQAGYIYRPKRERSPEHVLLLAKSLLSESGYDEVSLSSLSTGDYSQISPLMASMMDTCEASRVALSLPSMRVNTLTEEMAAIVKRVRKTGFTIAPEAGTQRLRDVINKGISEADILHTAQDAFSAGWESLKLYFMIGLPTENDDDIDGILHLVSRIRQASKGYSKRKVKLHVAISSFVPKSHTPFQWETMDTCDELRRKQEYLKQHLRRRAIQPKWHTVEASYLEGVFARGDRRLSNVLREAHALGCQFDGWSEHFDFLRWQEAFARTKVDPDGYVYRKRSHDEIFPWNHIQTGVTTSFLWQERLNALAETGSPPCSLHCRRCGLCHDDLHIIDFGSQATSLQPEAPKANISKPVPRPKAFRIRAAFSKTGHLRFLSHRELIRVFYRAASRAKVPLAYSQGFNPSPLISFGPALPVGTEGLCEYVDFFLAEAVDVEQFHRTMNDTLPNGVKMLEASPIDLKAPSLSAIFTRFTYRVSLTEQLGDEGYTTAYFTTALETFRGQDVCLADGLKKRTEPVNIKPCIAELDLIDHHNTEYPELLMRITPYQGITIQPKDVLHYIFDMPYEK